MGFLQAFVFRCLGSRSRTKDASASEEGRGHRDSPARLEGGGKGGAHRGHREPTDNGIPGTKNNNQVFAFISRMPAAASGSRAEGGAPNGARPGLRTAQVGPRAGSAYLSRLFPVLRRVPSGSAKRGSKSRVRWEGWGRRPGRSRPPAPTPRLPRVRAPLPLTWRPTLPLGRPPLPRGREGSGDARSAPGQETCVLLPHPPPRPPPASLPSIPPGPRTPRGLHEPRPSSRRLPDRHPVPARPRPGFAQEKQEMRCSRSVSLLRNWSAGGVPCIPHSASRPSSGPLVGVLTSSPYSPAWRTSDSAGRRHQG